ncbi:MAG: hypothetical protein U0401_19605 [Anaerolineae bacterium]
MKKPQVTLIRLLLYVLVIVCILALSAHIIFNLLKPCNQLDIYLASSGCLHKMELQAGSNIQNMAYVHNITFSPNGELLASGVGVSIHLWRVSDGVLLQNAMSSKDYGDVHPVFTPNGENLISGEGSSYISIWRVRDGKLLHREQGHQARILSVDLSEDGNILATASDDDIKLWRVQDTRLQLLNVINQKRNGYVTIAFSTDDTKLYSSCWNEGVLTIRIWQISDGSLLNEYTLSGNSGLRVEFLPPKNLMAQVICLDRFEVVCDRSAIQLWRIEEGVLLDSFELFSGDAAKWLFPDGEILRLVI